MSRIRSKDTKPEMVVRKALHSAGLRFRLHRRDLAGKPDLVLAKHCVIVFVHGCFWHGHTCIDGRIPKSREEYWGPKIAKNKKRGEAAVRKLRSEGWRVFVIWECRVEAGAERVIRAVTDAKRSVSRKPSGGPDAEG